MLSGLANNTSYTVSYSKDGTPVAPVSLTTSSSGVLIIDNLTSGIYNQVSISLNGCSRVDAQTLTLTAPNAPTFSVTKTDIASCGGTGNLMLSGLINNSSYTISYNKDGTPVAPVSLTTSSSGVLIIDNLTSGIYNQVSISLNGCSRVDAQTYTLTAPNAPAFSVNKTDITTCGGTGNLMLSGLANNTSYTVSYSKDGTPVAPVSLTTSSSGVLIIDNLTSGIYNQVSISLNGCSRVDAQTLTLTAPNAPTFSVTKTDIASCGGTGNLMLSGLINNSSYTISYNKDGTPVAPVSLTTSASGVILISDLTAGMYSDVTVALNGCSRVDAQTYTLTAPNAPTYSISKNDITSCGSNGSLDVSGLSSNTNYTISYSKDGNPVAPISITSSASGSLVISNLTPGDYSQITLANNGCSRTDANLFSFTNPTTPNFTVAKSDILSCSGFGNITLSGLVPGSSYQLSYTYSSTNVSPISVVANQNGTIQLLNLSSGDYSNMKLLASNNCSTTYQQLVSIVDLSNNSGDMWYSDSDGDTYGNPLISQQSCIQPNGYVSDNTDCNDNDATLNPLSKWYADADGDNYGNLQEILISCTQPIGYVINNFDCNDTDASISPITIWYADTDADNYGNPLISQIACSQPAGYVKDNADCDDNNVALNPTTIWYEDADHDGYGNLSIYQISCIQPVGYVNNTNDCNDADATIDPNTMWYADSDGDSYGNPSISLMGCVKPAGYVRDNTDCNDSDVLINPITVWYADADNDGFGTLTVTQVGCSPPIGFTLDDTDCDDLVQGKTVPAKPILNNPIGTVCIGSVGQIEVENPDADILWVWSAPIGIIVSSSSSVAMVSSSTSTTQTIEVTAVTGCGTSPTLQIPITFSSSPSIPTSILGTEEICPDSRVTFSTPVIQGATTYTWTVPSGFTIIQGQNTELITVDIGSAISTPTSVLVQTSNTCGISQPISLNLIDGKCAQDPLFIPNVFTPGSSDENGVWTIDGAQDYPDLVIKIVNRWGSPIFESIGYGNPWDGTFNGKLLPTGTYYYSIDLRNGSKPRTGSVTIVY